MKKIRFILTAIIVLLVVSACINVTIEVPEDQLNQAIDNVVEERSSNNDAPKNDENLTLIPESPAESPVQLSEVSQNPPDVIISQETEVSSSEQAEEAESDEKSEPASGSKSVREKDGMEILYVPGGSFEMGTTELTYTKPVRTVDVDGFYIDRYEVTNGQYRRCVSEGACQFGGENTSNTRERYYDNPVYTNHPVINLNWYEARDYCQWVGGDLPTEAQWEKAARGTDGRRYPWGDFEPNKNKANYNQNEGDTMPVGSYAQNVSPYGAMDMAGNVWEWTQDWYADSYNPDDTDNPMGPTAGQSKTIRGGCWYYDATYIRSAHRSKHNPLYRYYNVGFRCVTP
ncbi:MAG: formylglycine-generating enzyme family protein [Anaerolineaceae bacterium]|nr:formylglycine-generating enzyme family protein [Anaerolineaceae bacterium]